MFHLLCRVENFFRPGVQGRNPQQILNISELKMNFWLENTCLKIIEIIWEEIYFD